MDDNILEKKIIVNGVPYINGEILLDFLRLVFENTRNSYQDENLEKLSYNIDMLLEIIEYNDGERE